tara:strand:+ start:87 stop:296 length:210 start_codon:yes stop_codon:yes gene_type:complete
MANGSHLHDTDEMMLAVLFSDGSNATKVAERFRNEVARADENAQKNQLLQAKIEGLMIMARVFASKGVI